MNLKDIKKEDIIDYLWSINNKEEIREYWNVLKRRNKQLTERLTSTFKVGDEVKFENKNGEVEIGVVKKVNKKTLNVKAGFYTYRISPSLLTKTDS